MWAPEYNKNLWSLWIPEWIPSGNGALRRNEFKWVFGELQHKQKLLKNAKHYLLGYLGTCLCSFSGHYSPRY